MLISLGISHNVQSSVMEYGFVEYFRKVSRRSIVDLR